MSRTGLRPVGYLERSVNDMKMIYLILFTASATLLLLGSFITFAPPIEESFAAHLVSLPEQWDIAFLGEEPIGIFIAKDSKAAKSLLLTFLTKNQLPTYRSIGHVAYGLMIVCAFSLVGMIRENKFKRKRQDTEPSARGDGIPPPQP